MNHPQTASVRERVSAEEWEARVNLAACYRFAAYFRMTDLIYTHISARVPGAGGGDGGRRQTDHSIAGGG
jgi:hypothetical protein